MLDIQDAISFLEKREARKAADLLEKMVAEMPAYATARVLLARSYEALSEWDQALAVWREVLQILPNSPVVREGLERSVRRSGARRRRARADEEAVAASPADPEGAATDTTPPDVPVLAPELLEADEVDPWTPGSPAKKGREPGPSRERAASDAVEPAAFDEVDETDFSDLHDVQDTGTPHYEDLDRLIHELESARIVPRSDLESLPSPNLEDDIEDVVSETLARIYASQGQYDEAARVYELLAGQHPDEADDFLQKASNMRSRASDGESSV